MDTSCAPAASTLRPRLRLHFVPSCCPLTPHATFPPSKRLLRADWRRADGDCPQRRPAQRSLSSGKGQAAAGRPWGCRPSRAPAPSLRPSRAPAPSLPRAAADSLGPPGPGSRSRRMATAWCGSRTKCWARMPPALPLLCMRLTLRRDPQTRSSTLRVCGFRACFGLKRGTPGVKRLKVQQKYADANLQSLQQRTSTWAFTRCSCRSAVGSRCVTCRRCAAYRAYASCAVSQLPHAPPTPLPPPGHEHCV